jgi:hypothetical protein
VGVLSESVRIDVPDKCEPANQQGQRGDHEHDDPPANLAPNNAKPRAAWKCRTTTRRSVNSEISAARTASAVRVNGPL